ncbi:peroxide stress protein YaaA [Leifsonia sp. F6_8S_P_1B]|uniref:Peroxide stress protein YaaA n=1 Tax=Leifsonia williamsii TaxID=3035919 RepID=A0ABT8KB78_9MICO|nr:peroxide stress protein YaaA [Leifsonia williamsii]MDN4614708.1 peroxide stress protein YaaA [Leifsonia williamsii]
MLILLPPSETKRDGGAGAPLDLGALRFPSLAPIRREVVEAVLALSEDHDATLRALKLGPKQAGEVERNRAIPSSPTHPALLRYTGVLYDALDADSLTEAHWAYAAEHVAVQSALLGIVGAADPIPAYRLSFDSRLSTERGVPSLKKRWAAAGAAALVQRPGLILDLRSEGYAALAPLPDRDGAHYVRVLARDSGGHVRALNHFNKQAKGLFTRALIEAGVVPATTDELLAWAADEGYELTPADDGTRDLNLVVPEVAGAPGRLMAVLRAS